MTHVSKVPVEVAILDLESKKLIHRLVEVPTIAALGTNQATAAALTSGRNIVTGGNGTVGVVLPVTDIDLSVTVLNSSSSALLVYPGLGDQINAAGANADYSLAANAEISFRVTAIGSWVAPTVTVTGTTTSSTTAELDTLHSVVAGTTSASKALVVDANKALDTLSLGALNGSDSSFGITGQATAQGGAVIVTGGTSTTSGNAGGAVDITGGTPGATGVGGAIVVVGAVGGATSGAGGAASVTGGAGTNGNAAGGAASLVGGAGQGSAAGGAITITSGAAGATGVAGAVNVAVGAATAGAGSSVTITGGNGAGGTAAGGDVNLVPGTAVSTGVPGEVKVNGVAGTFEITYTAPLMTTAVPASGTAQPIYIATRAVRVKKAYASVVTHGTSETFAITKDTTGNAPGSGSNVLAAVITTAASNTPATQAASATIATCTLAAGDRLSFLTGGTIGSAAGLTITVLMVPV